jgi:hypothetical protein
MKFIILLFMLLFFNSVNAQPVTKKWLEEDKRLSKEITFSAQRIYIGEFLEKVSQESGISISSSDRDRAAGEPISVHLQKIPVRDVMDALWSLIGYQNATWLWKRTGDKENFSYVLTRPASAQKFSQRMNANIQSDFENHVQNMINGVKKPDLITDEITKDYLESEDYKKAMQAFSETVPESEIQSLLQKKTDKMVHVNQLGETTKAYLDMVMNGSTHLINGKPAPSPKWVRFHVTDRDTVTPTLYFEIDGHGSGSIAGGLLLADKWRKDLINGWILPQDLVENSETEKIVWETDTTKSKLREARDKDKFPDLSTDIHDFGEDNKISFLAHLPKETGGQRISQAKKTVGILLDSWVTHAPEVVHKWRGNILLLSYPKWFTEDSDKDNIPYAVVKQFRQWHEAGEVPTLADLCRLATSVSESDIPSLGKVLIPFRFVGTTKDVLRWAGRSPENMEAIQSVTGVPVNRELREALKSFIPEQVVDGIKRIRINIKKSEHSNIGQTTFIYEFIVYDEKLRPRSIVGTTFTIIPKTTK